MHYSASKRNTHITNRHNLITKRMYDVASEICEKYKEQQIKFINELNGIKTYPNFNKNTLIKDSQNFASVRVINCLRAGGLDVWGDLEKFHISDLLAFRNMGKRSIKEIEEFAAYLNINLYK